MPSVSLTLLVLMTHQLDRLRTFYATLGIDCTEGRHGTGPTHFAELPVMLVSQPRGKESK